jgi:hypothetical protein
MGAATMTADFNREPAKVYRFPVSPRMRAAEAKSADRELPHICESGGWYHEEAIREAARSKQ